MAIVTVIVVNEIGAPIRPDVRRQVFIVDVLYLRQKSGIIGSRAGSIESLGVSVDVVVVGAGEADAELGETQFAVVASLLRADIAEVRDGKSRFVGSIACAIIRGVLEVVRQAESGSELVATIDAQAGRVDADRCHVATDCT